MKNLLIVILSFIYSLFNAQSLQWSTFTDSATTLSSPRAIDLNNDGILDIVLGAGTDSTYSNYGIIAFDGLNGNNLWTVPTTDEVFGSAVFNDINADNVPDVFIGGRNAQFYAINGANGNIIWEAFPQGSGLNPADSGLYNFYSAQIIPDQNGDLISDVLVANGGDHNANPWSSRPPGHLMVIDGANGNVLAKAVMPDSNETYCSPIVADLNNNGVLYVIYGTGGEHHGGSIWVADLTNGLMNNDLTGSIALATHSSKGFIAPASVGDFSGAGYLDIIVQSFGGTIYRFDGSNFNQKWSVTLPNSESSSAPVIGNFNGGDLLPDVFAVAYKGSAPSYFDFYQLMINGTTGNIEWIDSIGDMHFASANAFDANEDGRDDVLISLNNNIGHFEHELLLIDFQNNQVSTYFQNQGGANIASTPYVGDIDNNNKLDIVYTFRADSINPGAWNGIYTEKILTSIWVPISGIAWGGYMGTNSDGHYNYTSVNCGTGSIISSLNISQPSCNGVSDGTVSINTINGTPPYTYLWSDGSINDSLINVGAGTYKIIISDSAGCHEIRSVTLNDPYIISFGGIQNNPCQGDSIGTATLSSSGCPCMFSTCTYLWENGDSIKTATGLSAGYWSVIITHMDGCVVIDSVEISEGPPVIDSSWVLNPNCHNINDGSIQLFPNDTTFTSFFWDNGDSTALIDNLQPGNYSVIINNLNCYDSLFFTIDSADSIFISENHSDVLCYGNSDGTININALGGAEGFTYLLNGVNYNTNNFTALSTGNYSVYVIDSLACLSDTLDILIYEPAQLTGVTNSTPETDNGWNDGSASVIVSGGVSPYYYQWDDPSNQTNPNATGLSTGNYIITITDSNGCTYSDTVNVGTTMFIDNLGNEVYINVYPNPFIENLTIETNFLKAYNLTVYNASGKLIKELYNMKGKSIIKRELLPAGLYILCIELNNKLINYPIIIE